MLEEGAGRRVLLATPTTLIALLQTVHYGWRQEQLAENAEKISEQGRLLHERVATLVEHWSRLGHGAGQGHRTLQRGGGVVRGAGAAGGAPAGRAGGASKKSVDELPRLDLRPRRQMAAVGGTCRCPSWWSRRQRSESRRWTSSLSPAGAAALLVGRGHYRPWWSG